MRHASVFEVLYTINDKKISYVLSAFFFFAASNSKKINLLISIELIIQVDLCFTVEKYFASQ